MGARQEPHYIGGEGISCHQKLHLGLEEEGAGADALEFYSFAQEMAQDGQDDYEEAGISEDEEEVVLENVN
uniref:Uncharacterized protein n=1 Tax=Ditylenchus dipsaci TaxID=166011 RepID=A0A915DXH4_9BILA